MERELPHERLARLRKAERLTQEVVSNRLGCTTKTYRTWENGSTTLSDVHFLELLADLYHVSTDYLLCRTDDMNIGNTEIAKATGLSETSIELLRFLNAPSAVIGNMQEHHADTIRFLNRALEAAAPAAKRTGDPFPVHTIFSEMERYIHTERTLVVQTDGKENGRIVFHDGSKYFMENAARLYSESVMTMIRKELDYLQEVQNNG